MLRSLKNLLDTVLAGPAPAAAGQAHVLQLATAVLLVEVMRAEPDIDLPERLAVVQALRDRFALGADEVRELVELAEQTARGSSDFFQFTSAINEAFDQDQKVRMVEHLWRVAYSDGQLGDHENHLISRIAGLLHVPHGQYIAAKMRARTADA